MKYQGYIKRVDFQDFFSLTKKMKVQISSRESIKPSSPTPPHLKTFDLCFFDQISPPIYIPILLFYANNSENSTLSSNIHCRLKTSLSETLTTFYPVAGRISIGSTSIDCNDEGVDYLEARVINSQLSEVMMQPNVDVLKLLLPCNEPHFDETETGHGPEFGSKVLLAIQVNVFNCGGIVISVCLSHKISDAYSLSKFIDCWAAKARNSNKVIHPIRYLSSIFPQRGLLGHVPSSVIYRGTGNLVMKRFIFDSSKIASLRAKVTNHSSVLAYATRVEVVSALIWKRFMELARTKGGLVKEHVAIHAVNFRGRLDPPLNVHENTLGNVIASTFTANEELKSKKELHVLVSKLRDAIRKIDGEYLRRILCGDEYEKTFLDRGKGVRKGEIGMVRLTSWCRFAWYEADFGFGKPIWASTTGLPCKDTVILMDTSSGDGIEAWVNMLEEDMAVFEQDEEFL